MRILVGLESREEVHLLAYVRLLGRTGEVIVRVLHVIEYITVMGGPMIETEEEARSLVEAAVFSLRMADIAVSGAVRYGRVNRIAAVILDDATTWQTDTIVVSGRRSYGLRRLTGRGVREQLVRRSMIPTALVSSPARGPGKMARDWKKG
jgi:nucleotide-binding universal stress UspA family protein